MHSHNLLFCSSDLLSLYVFRQPPSSASQASVNFSTGSHGPLYMLLLSLMSFLSYEIVQIGDWISCKFLSVAPDMGLGVGDLKLNELMNHAERISAISKQNGIPSTNHCLIISPFNLVNKIWWIYFPAVCEWEHIFILNTFPLLGKSKKIQIQKASITKQDSDYSV